MGQGEQYVRSHAKAASAGSTEGRRGSRVLFLGTLLAAIVAVLGVVPLAQADPAAPVYVPGGNFADGQFPGTSRLAVEPGTGNILVLNGSAITVLAPAPSLGAKLATIPVTGSPAALATDPGNGAVYYADNETGTVTRFLSNGAPTPTYAKDNTFTGPTQGSGPGQVGSIAGVAVDPTTHDVLVADPSNGLIDRFSPSGSFLSSFDGAASPTGGVAGATDIAVGPGGEIYVAVAGRVDRFAADGTADGELVLGGYANFLAVAQQSGRVLVAADGGFFSNPNLYLFDSAGTLRSSVAYPPMPAAAFGASTSALAVDSSSGRAYGTDIDVISPTSTRIVALDSAVRPGVEISPASQVGPYGAHLEGSVEPGEDGTLPASLVEGTARFVLTAPGLSPIETPAQGYPATAGAQAVVADVTGLTPNLTYSVRLVAQNALVSAETAPITFATPAVAPLTETGAATEIATTGATLRGTVNSYGLPTTYRFEYGTTTSYGSRVPAAHEASAGSGYQSQEMAQAITGLQPGTTYHYRLVAQNSVGTEVGADRTFATPTSTTGFPDRAYELVATGQAAATETGDLGAMARPGGNGLMFSSASSENSSVTLTSPRLLRYTSVRGPGGWKVTPLDPKTKGELPYFTYATPAVAEDLSHALVTSDLALAPGGYEGGGNLYMRDVQGGGLDFVGGNASHETFKQFAQATQSDKVLGATSDMSTVVFNSPFPFSAEATPEVTSTYEWSQADGLRLVSVMPNGAPATVSSQPVIQSGPEVFRVSEDASVIAFALDGTGVYARVDGETTVPLSVSQIPGDPTDPHPGTAVTVSGDGRYVVFSTSDETPLTADAPAQGGNLYRYDFQSGDLEYLGAGEIFAVTRDAKGIYFLAGADLKLSEDGQARDLGASIFAPVTGRSVSVNGRYLVLSAPGTVVPDQSAGAPRQVFLYDTVTDKWSCASCVAGGSGGGGYVPEPQREFLNNRMIRAVTDDGETFFSSEARLVNQDVNGRRDVYAYRDGAVRLISPGTSPLDATFMDASTDGGDVFFSTEEKLSPAADRIGYSVYDAKVGGGIAETLAPPPCQGEACQGASAPPLLSEPSAASGANQKARSNRRCRGGSAKAKKKRGQRCGKPRHQGKAKQHRGADSSRRAGR
jgi:hypothetical protein